MAVKKDRAKIRPSRAPDKVQGCLQPRDASVHAYLLVSMFLQKESLHALLSACCLYEFSPRLSFSALLQWVSRAAKRSSAFLMVRSSYSKMPRHDLAACHSPLTLCRPFFDARTDPRNTKWANGERIARYIPRHLLTSWDTRRHICPWLSPARQHGLDA